MIALQVEGQCHTNDLEDLVENKDEPILNGLCALTHPTVKLTSGVGQTTVSDVTLSEG